MLCVNKQRLGSAVGSNNEANSWWKIIREFFEQKVWFLMWLLSFAGLILLISNPILINFGFQPSHKYIGWFAVLAILASAPLLIGKLLYSAYYRFKQRSYTNCLGEDEKEILRFYFVKNVRSQSVDESSGAAELLIKHGILRIATNVPLVFSW